MTVNTEVGSSDYNTVVTGAGTKEPGLYTLVVRYVAKGHTGSCEILRRSITVVADKTQLIIALVMVGLLLGMLALGVYLPYKNREGALHFLLSFFSYEVTLAADILSEAWDFAGPSLVCARLALIIITPSPSVRLCR